MFSLKWTLEARSQFDVLRQRAEVSLAARRKSNKTKATAEEGRFKQAHKCASLLAENPRHPGLRTHEYHALEHPYEKDGKVFEAYLQNRTPGAYRLFWCYGPGKREITTLAITPHP